MMRRLFLISCLMFAASSTIAAADEQPACRQFIDTMHGRADAVFHDPNQTFMQKQAALSRLFQEGVDIGWVARSVAGQYWESASQPQQQEFYKAYATYLTNHYIGGLSEDDINGMQNFVVQNFSLVSPHHYQAHIDITQKSDEPMSVDLTLEEDPIGSCRVRDFTAEGVSLLQSQSDQIQSLAASGGLASVTQKLMQLAH